MKRLVAATPILAALPLAACATQALDITPALQGNWGGQHIGIVVGTLDSVVQFDCAEGTIFGPYSVEKDGRFAWVGDFKRGTGGPVRVGQYEVREEPPPMRATYSGAIRGSQMSLTINLEDGTVLGPFALERFKEPQLSRCL